MLAAVSNVIKYGVQFLREGTNQPIRGASIGVASRAGRGWSRDTWAKTDARGWVQFRLPLHGTYRLASSVRGRRREVVVTVTYPYQTNRLWVRSDGTLRLEAFTL